MRNIILFTLMAIPALNGQQYTLGVGVYPGDPKENFAPATHLDQTYRNLALHRPAYQSSSYDYNLTAQLITDGIKDTKLPRWVAVSSSEQGELKKNEREWLLDHNWLTGVTLKGTGGWVQVQLAGGEGPLEVDRVDIDARVRVGQALACPLVGARWSQGRTTGRLGRSWAAGRARTVRRANSNHPSHWLRRRTAASIV